MIIFRMDGSSIPQNTVDLEQFSVYEPDTWKRFQMTGQYKHLEELALYVPEKYQDQYNKAFKDYMYRLGKDVYPRDDDEVRETRKEA